MLTCYAGGWRRLVPLLPLRPFDMFQGRLRSTRGSMGRPGSFPNAVRQVIRSVDAAKEPVVFGRNGGEHTLDQGLSSRQVRIINTSATDLGQVKSGSIDLVLTDRPTSTTSTIQNSPTSTVLAGQALLGKERAQIGQAESGRGGRSKLDAELFSKSLGQAFAEIERVLRPRGQLIFTFRHRSERGWKALEDALSHASGLVCQTTFPCSPRAPTVSIPTSNQLSGMRSSYFDVPNQSIISRRPSGRCRRRAMDRTVQDADCRFPSVIPMLRT